MKGNGELPLNWAVTKLGILFQLEYGKGLTKKDRVESGAYPVYGSNGIVGYHDKYLVEGPVLIVGRKGAAGAISYSSGSCWPIDTTYFVRDSEYIDIKFSYYLLKSLNLAKHEKSTAIPGLNRNDAYDETVVLPPLNEQTRIVAKIEALFAELDAGVASLKKAQAQLKTYRQALLKHAFSGKLTEQWRAENGDQLEDGPTLLQRIRAERQARYVAEVAAWEENGRQGQKPRPPKDLPPLTPAELEELPQLPAGWVWASCDQLSERIVDCLHSTAKFRPSGFMCIDTNSIKPGKIVYEKIRFVDEDTFHERNRRMIPREDDVMFSREGALLGVAVRVPKKLQFCLGQRMMIFRLENGVVSKYFEMVLNSRVFKNQYRKDITGSASPHLNIQDIRKFGIPLPSLAEQKQIVRELESRISVIDQLEQTITTALQQAEALRQAILKKAFSGQLAPQDPADEPAAVLLARIRAAKP